MSTGVESIPNMGALRLPCLSSASLPRVLQSVTKSLEIDIMQDLLNTTALNLLHAREPLSALTPEVVMLAALLDRYEDDSVVVPGLVRTLDRWHGALQKLEASLEAVQDELRLAKQAAEPAEPELTPAEKLDRRRWQAEKFRQMADELEREGVAEFAAAIADQDESAVEGA